MIKVAPSILAADPINLEKDVRRAVQAGCGPAVEGNV